MASKTPIRVAVTGAAGNIGYAAIFRLASGAVFAWGSSDIDDPGSYLHRRYEIGVHSHGRYHSIDTSKYTTAPLFALEAADRVCGKD